MQEDTSLTYIEEFMSNKVNHVLWSRAIAWWIDFAIMWLILIAAELVLGNSRYQSTVLIWVFLSLSYLPISEGLTGCSIGKYLVRARVIDKHGNKPGIFKGCIRMLFRIIEVNPLLAGGAPAGIIVLFSSKGQRLGDMVATTFVIDHTKYKNLISDQQGTNTNR